MKAVAFVVALILLVGCGWTRHNLTPAAQSIQISKIEPQENCQMVGGFDTYHDCLRGLGTGNTNIDAQYECIKWKTDKLGGNYAVLDFAVGDGYFKGRSFKCTQ